MTCDNPWNYVAANAQHTSTDQDATHLFRVLRKGEPDDAGATANVEQKCI